MQVSNKRDSTNVSKEIQKIYYGISDKSDVMLFKENLKKKALWLMTAGKGRGNSRQNQTPRQRQGGREECVGLLKE